MQFWSVFYYAVHLIKKNYKRKTFLHFTPTWSSLRKLLSSSECPLKSHPRVEKPYAFSSLRLNYCMDKPLGYDLFTSNGFSFIGVFCLPMSSEQSILESLYLKYTNIWECCYISSLSSTIKEINSMLQELILFDPGRDGHTGSY